MKQSMRVKTKECIDNVSFKVEIKNWFHSNANICKLRLYLKCKTNTNEDDVIVTNKSVYLKASEIISDTSNVPKSSL